MSGAALASLLGAPAVRAHAGSPNRHAASATPAQAGFASLLFGQEAPLAAPAVAADSGAAQAQAAAPPGSDGQINGLLAVFAAPGVVSDGADADPVALELAAPVPAGREPALTGGSAVPVPQRAAAPAPAAGAGFLAQRADMLSSPMLGQRSFLAAVRQPVAATVTTATRSAPALAARAGAGVAPAPAPEPLDVATKDLKGVAADPLQPAKADGASERTESRDEGPAPDASLPSPPAQWLGALPAALPLASATPLQGAPNQSAPIQSATGTSLLSAMSTPLQGATGPSMQGSPGTPAQGVAAVQPGRQLAPAASPRPEAAARALQSPAGVGAEPVGAERLGAQPVGASSSGQAQRLDEPVFSQAKALPGVPAGAVRASAPEPASTDAPQASSRAGQALPAWAAPLPLRAERAGIAPHSAVAGPAAAPVAAVADEVVVVSALPPADAPAVAPPLATRALAEPRQAATLPSNTPGAVVLPPAGREAVAAEQGKGPAAPVAAPAKAPEAAVPGASAAAPAPGFEVQASRPATAAAPASSDPAPAPLQAAPAQRSAEPAAVNPAPDVATEPPARTAPVATPLAVPADAQGNERRRGRVAAAESSPAAPAAPIPTGASLPAQGDALPALAEPAAARQVADQVKYWIQNGIQNAELKFDGLGPEPVQVSISMSGNEAQVVFRSDQAPTRELLGSAIAQLEQSLRSEGLALSGAWVGGSGAQGEQRAPSQPQANFAPPVAAGVPPPEPAPAPAARRLASERSVDLFV